MRRASYVIAAAAFLLAGGAFSSAHVAQSAEAIPVPDRLTEAGKIRFCTAPPYPPVIYQEGDKIMGSDADIGAAIGEKLGVDVEWVVIGFDGFIAAVQGDKCDGYLGASTHTEERAKQVHFTDYVNVGAQYLVRAGNPLGIRSESAEHLSGHAVSVLVGTTEKQALDELNAKLQAEGKPLIDIQVFNADTDAGMALVQDKVDAYGSDSPGLTFYLNKFPDQVELALPEPVRTKPWGIATRLDDTELHAALQATIDALYADGTMMQILEKWNLPDIALK